MKGIIGYGAYVPYWRLQRSSIATALGASAGKGTRSVASYDEDTTSMGVEAARCALSSVPAGWAPRLLAFATTDPPYLDKTNAAAVHAALGLPGGTSAFDVLGSTRSGIAATWLAEENGGLAVLSDIRTGRPGSADEASGGDAAVALAFGEGDSVLAYPVARASASAEFLDRWRLPGELASHQWEERFGVHAYRPLVNAAVPDALKQAGITAEDLDRVIVTGMHQRAVKAAALDIGASERAYDDDLYGIVGNSGTAHWALLLADVLDRCGPNETIAIVHLADGVDVWVLRTTAALAEFRPAAAVRETLVSTRDDLPYPLFLTWRGFLQREPPRRPEPDRPAAPPSLRSEAWKFGLVGSRDEQGFVHLPPERVSMGSGEIDRMEPVRMADVPATIATFTVDHLAFTPSPPLVIAVVDFDGGGRFQCEVTDVDPSALRIGQRVEMTFRRLFTAGGVHDYFWKARPLRASVER